MMTPEQQERALVLLDAVQQMFQKQKETIYVQSIFEMTAFYDDEECDGYCINEEIQFLLDEVKK